MATATIQKAAKKPFESVKLNAILANLNAEPRLQLRNVQQLKVTYAYRNDHFGARHFAKEIIPRLSFVNPTVNIQIEKALKTVEEKWRPDIQVVFENGQTATIDMHQKWSTAITKELMDLAGGEMWKRWVKTAVQKGTPVLPGEEKEKTIVRTEEDLPSLQEYRETPAAQALAAKRAAAKAAATKAAIAKSEQRKAKKASPGLASPSEPTPA